MTDWECPNCHGGFDEPVHDGLENVKRCPWCGQEIDGSYEFEPKTISRTIHERQEDQHGGFLGPGCFSRLLERWRS